MFAAQSRRSKTNSLFILTSLSNYPSLFTVLCSLLFRGAACPAMLLRGVRLSRHEVMPSAKGSLWDLPAVCLPAMFCGGFGGSDRLYRGTLSRERFAAMRAPA